MHIDTGIQNPEERYRSQVSLGGYEPHFLFEQNETFHRYNTTGNQWNVEVRGFFFKGITTTLEYKTKAVVDSFTRGIQMPKLDFARFVKQLREEFKDIEKF